MITEKQHRPFVQRLRNDPRVRAVMDGIINQAMIETENLYPRSYEGGRAAMAFAARRAAERAMSFVLEQDREYQDVLIMLDEVLARQLDVAKMTVRDVTITFPAPVEAPADSEN